MYLSNLNRLTNHPPARRDVVNDQELTMSQPAMNRGSKGFTLIEILVVMAIMATLLGLGVGAIKSMSTAKGVSSAVPIADAIFDQARQVAKSSGTPTRVVIYADTTGDNVDKRERFLRLMGVATGRDAAGLPVDDIADVTQWRLVSRAVTLPSNTFFNANLSNQDPTATETAIFPGSAVAKNCYVYQFNSEGALIDSTGTPITDGQFVVQAGKLLPGQTTPTEATNAKRDIGGFRIWANGRMAMFRSPNQIVSTSDNPEF
jgi:prepilin-type N-terminal cleavage/methylation domain-containing protein